MRRVSTSPDRTWRPLAALLGILPQLVGLTELDLDVPLRMENEQSDDWLPELHLLPALRVLRTDIDMWGPPAAAAAFARSVALVPKLEVLQVHSGSNRSNFTLLVCEQLRLRCEELRGVSDGIGQDAAANGLQLRLRKLLLPPQYRDNAGGQQQLSLSHMLAHPRGSGRLLRTSDIAPWPRWRACAPCSWT